MPSPSAHSTLQVGVLWRTYRIELFDGEGGDTSIPGWSWRVDIWKIGDRFVPSVWRVEFFNITAALTRYGMKNMRAEERLAVQCPNADWRSMSSEDGTAVLKSLAAHFSRVLEREVDLS